jgi:hypothetical protein
MMSSSDGLVLDEVRAEMVKYLVCFLSQVTRIWLFFTSFAFSVPFFDCSRFISIFAIGSF